MRHKAILIILLLLTCSLSNACDYGKTYRDSYGKPDSYDLVVANDDGAYYFPQGSIYVAKGTIWEKVFFDKNGIIEIATPYSHTISFHWPDKGKEPYVLYKGHRWYPQHHGIIYVYKDGKER